MKAIYFILSLLFLFYIALPTPAFPEPPDDALRSKESADTETPLRRAYFTNATREEVMEHYLNEFKGYRLNYPPEESGAIIRDQTRSTFLEEIVRPLRESLYINGFEPKNAKDAINIEGLPWRQKIIVKFVPSNLIVRIVVGLLIIISLPLVYKEWRSK